MATDDRAEENKSYNRASQSYAQASEARQTDAPYQKNDFYDNLNP